MADNSSGSSLAEGIEALDIPEEAYEKVRTLCEVIFGDDCGHLENVRLVWQVPSPNAGQEAEREGWQVYECDVLGHRFAVPQGAPIPMIRADHYDSEEKHESILYRYVHPDLVENREVLQERLVAHLHEEIQSSLASLSTAFNLLEALRHEEKLPEGASPSPYHPDSQEKRVGYEPIDEQGPLNSEEK